MSVWSKYVIAKSIEEALETLRSTSGPARLIAGGTDFLLDLQQGRHPPVHTLVDITHIPEMNLLELRADMLFIGAAVPVSMITDSTLVLEHAQAVSEACGLIGGPQVRNTATLGGNVAHALPAADGMIALCALDAQAEIANSQGRRLEPVLNLFRGPGITALLPTEEILVGFHIPFRKGGQASAFGRVMRPQGVALPIINLAAWVSRSEKIVEDIRIVLGPSGPVPQRAHELEKCLIGLEYGPSALKKAIEIIPTSMRFRSSPYRTGAEYRYQLSEVLFEDVVGIAWKRAERVKVA